MSRRLLIVSILTLLFSASLAAVAAVGGIVRASSAVTPLVHRSGEDGYFVIDQALPHNAPERPFSLEVRVDSGDIFLAHARASGSASADHGAVTSGSSAAPAGRIIVNGRFHKPGPAQLTILAGAPDEALKPLMVFTFTLPEAESLLPEVRESWARQQREALRLVDPRSEDSFTQYWDGVVAQRYGLAAQVREPGGRFRREPPDIYSIFTGAAAIQESLQLELLGEGSITPAQRAAIAKTGGTQQENVPLAKLAGPTVRSHLFREMLEGRNPNLPPLASYIPADQYAVFFSDIRKEIELADLMDEWGGNLLHQAKDSARDFKVREKVSRQLCLENSWLTRMFGDRVIADMAFTGSDPFLKEGTAFTVLFTLKDGKRFSRQMDKRYADAVSRGAIRLEFTINGVRGMEVATSDRSVSSCMVILGNTAVVSTSRAALARVVETWGKKMVSLAESDDFRYMRTIFPQNAGEEDIFIYLSDSHIRSLVGPRWKIGEARRMRCAGNMNFIANARLWFRAEKRREPTLEELSVAGYLGKTRPGCPDHGTYGIDGNGTPHCSLHNRPGLLTPVGETPLESVTPREAAEYQAFVDNYNRYWTRFFDPIGIRVKMGRDIRIETCILPLIENSWYDGLAAFSGRGTGAIAETALLPRTVVSLRGRLSKDWLGKTYPARQVARNGFNLEWLGDEVTLNLCDGPVLFSAGGSAMGVLGQRLGRSSSLEPLVTGYLVSALNLPTYLTVKVNDPKKAEESVPQLFRSLAPGHTGDDGLTVEMYAMEEYRGRKVHVASFNLWLVRLRLFMAVVDDRLVIASRRDIITDLVDNSAAGAGKKVAAHEASMELAVYRSAFKKLEEAVILGWQEDLRHACHKNLPAAGILLKALGLPEKELAATVAGLRGYSPYCPSGGKYMVDRHTGAATCSLHGDRGRPKQPAVGDQSSETLKLVNSLERVSARLAFTPEGMMTTVEIKRAAAK